MTPIRKDLAEIRLETSSLLLRPWEDRDREAMADIQGDPLVRRCFLRTLTRQEALDDLDLAQQRARENGFHFQAAELKATGDLVGQIGIGVVPDKTRAAIPNHPRVEIGWVLAPRFWGRGLAPDGARAWLGYAWSIGLDEIVAFTAKKNLPSQRVMQKIGMQREPSDDYEHPTIPPGHELRPHMVFRIRNPASPAGEGS